MAPKSWVDLIGPDQCRSGQLKSLHVYSTDLSQCTASGYLDTVLLSYADTGSELFFEIECFEDSPLI